MKNRLLLFMLISVMPVTIARAGDASQYRIIGFSKDGKYFAFERYGTYDGSAFPYSEIFILDVCKNDYANSPVRLVIEESVDEDVVRKQNMTNVKAILAKFGIDGTIKGTSALARSTDKGVVPFEYGGQKMSLTLEQTATGQGQCEQPEKKLALSLTRKGAVTVLQKDTKVPKSRGCAYSYSIEGIYCQASSVAVIVSYDTPGYEGPNTRQIAISGCMK